jgi:hypothetical protein
MILNLGLFSMLIDLFSDDTGGKNAIRFIESIFSKFTQHLSIPLEVIK